MALSQVPRGQGQTPRGQGHTPGRRYVDSNGNHKTRPRGSTPRSIGKGMPRSQSAGEVLSVCSTSVGARSSAQPRQLTLSKNNSRTASTSSIQHVPNNQNYNKPTSSQKPALSQKPASSQSAKRPGATWSKSDFPRAPIPPRQLPHGEILNFLFLIFIGMKFLNRQKSRSRK